MSRPLALIALVVGVLALVVWAVAPRLGEHWPIAVLFAGALGAALVARPLIDLVFESAWSIKSLALRDLQGRLYVWRGLRIPVHEDEDGGRWLHAARVRRAVPGLPRDAVLRGLDPDACREIGGAPYVEATALSGWLAGSGDAQAARFRDWLGRELIKPVANRRAAERNRRLEAPRDASDPRAPWAATRPE